MATMLHIAAYCLAALWLLIWGGNWACQKLFETTGMKAVMTATTQSALQAGRVIGGLERLIMAAGVIFQSWEIIAAVIALKSVARFKELDKQFTAEYFLAGSLFSLLWALMLSLAFLGYDRNSGGNIQQRLIGLVEPEKAAAPPSQCSAVFVPVPTDWPSCAMSPLQRLSEPQDAARASPQE
jgi:hypothetical protein